jgi:hypothetical protein
LDLDGSAWAWVDLSNVVSWARVEALMSFIGFEFVLVPMKIRKLRGEGKSTLLRTAQATAKALTLPEPNNKHWI